jgi:anti-sigma28 factor (negative regulator of flagellin synthesis)
VPEVRPERVQEVRSALESGDFTLNPEAIAQALLRQGVLDDLLGR